jgi:hypothetical protein
LISSGSHKPFNHILFGVGMPCGWQCSGQSEIQLPPNRWPLRGKDEV